MAKPKQKVLVDIMVNLFEPIRVWIDNPGDALRDISTIEGIVRCRVCTDGPIRIMVDPRYDTQEIAQEIRDLLAAEVPEVFKEES